MNTELAHILDMVHETGERVVIYDREKGTSVVVSPLHQVINAEVQNEHVPIEQVNRQIAEVKEDEKQKELEVRVSQLEKQLQEHPLRDPFEEDFFHAPEWHKISDVLEREYNQTSDEAESESKQDEEIDFSWLDEGVQDDISHDISVGYDDSLHWDEDVEHMMQRGGDNDFLYMEEIEDIDDTEFEEFLERLPGEDVEYVQQDEKMFQDMLADVVAFDTPHFLEEESAEQVSPRERMQEGFSSYTQNKSIPHTPGKEIDGYSSNDDDGPKFFEEPI